MARPLNFFIQIRNYKGQKPPKFWGKDKKVYEKVTYYPRHPGQVDPPIAPTKLLVIQRVKPYAGNPYWHKAILDQLHLNEKKSDITIVKNIPEICAQLWKVKHLIKVTPLNQPGKLPEDNDIHATWLMENGDLLLTPRVDPVREQLTMDHVRNPKRLDGETLSFELRMRWLNPWDT
ncbi:39S ribosomal protein L30, mitochondrial [Fopius arisanus]|uniref:Large ribosomal subunit protein uL30m n=1 Tax=Fopius arisanus TaxID=64838 RepID=A0A9R1T3R5_9HYME|nr:PREDICTED: 39S ribosomal protein L30, mitochondrial [Fopius arisanus]XP_011302249.1 PREDICTED: 39S ribosomal protein L30, mitochondrial [Fopius arisanus]